MGNKTRNAVQIILLGLVAILSVVYGVTSAKIQDLSVYYTFFIGLAFSLVLLVQSGIVTYFKESKYKKISFEDAMTYSLTFIAGAIFLSSLRIFPFFEEAIPTAIKGFLTITNIGVSVIATILVLITTIGIITKNK